MPGDSRPLELAPKPALGCWLAPVFAAAAIWLGFIATVNHWNIVIWPQTMARYGLPFLDMQGHLASSHAFANGTLVPGKPVPGDPIQRIHSGPTWMLWLGFTGLGPDHTIPFAAFCLAAFLATVAITIRPRNATESMTLLLCLLSPPLMLLVERGNIDLLVYVALAGAFALLGSSLVRARWYGWLLIAGFVGFKYYPALAFAGLTEMPANRRTKLLLLTLAAATVALFIGWNWQEILYVSGHQVENRFYPFFGSRELLLIIGCEFQAAIWISLLGWLVLTIGLAILPGPLSKGELAGNARKISFVGGAAIVLFCFLATSSPDYRLVFFLFCLPWLWTLCDPGPGALPALRRLSVLCLLSFLIAPWSGTLLGRASLAIESTSLWWTVILFKQATWWTMTSCLGALLLRLLLASGLELLGRARPT